MSRNHPTEAPTRSTRRSRLAAVSIPAILTVLAAACGGEERSEVRVPDAASQPTTELAPVQAALTSPVKAEEKKTEPIQSVATDTATLQAVTYGEAERVFQSGDYRKAADLFEAYAERVPTNPWGPYMLGISAWRAGDHPRAEAALKRTIEVDAKHTKGLLNLARVLLEQRKASDALDFVERVVALEPESGEGWRVMGNAHAELRMTDAAKQAYRKAIVLDPMDAWTINNLALLSIQEGKYEEALPPLARATELRPGMATFQNNLGIALEGAKHPAQAADAFRAALAVSPDHEKARVSLERVEPLVGAATGDGVELSALAGVFYDEVEGWRAEERAAATRASEGASPDLDKDR